MFFWMREILGWLLVAIALALLWMGVGLVSDPETPRVVEAGVCIFGALGLTRLGILLIRISTAARICQKEAPRGS